MPQVYPSQVVTVIDSLFPETKNETDRKPLLPLKWEHTTRLLAIIELTDPIPEELLVLDATQYTEYVASVAAIRCSLADGKPQKKLVQLIVAN